MINKLCNGIELNSNDIANTYIKRNLEIICNYNNDYISKAQRVLQYLMNGGIFLKSLIIPTKTKSNGTIDIMPYNEIENKGVVYRDFFTFNVLSDKKEPKSENFRKKIDAGGQNEGYNVGYNVSSRYRSSPSDKNEFIDTDDSNIHSDHDFSPTWRHNKDGNAICYGTYVIPWGQTNHYSHIYKLKSRPATGIPYKDSYNQQMRIEIEHISHFGQMALFCGIPSKKYEDLLKKLLGELKFGDVYINRVIEYIYEISTITLDISLGLFNQYKTNYQIFKFEINVDRTIKVKYDKKCQDTLAALIMLTYIGQDNAILTKEKLHNTVRTCSSPCSLYKISKIKPFYLLDISNKELALKVDNKVTKNDLESYATNDLIPHVHKELEDRRYKLETKLNNFPVDIYI